MEQSRELCGVANYPTPARFRFAHRLRCARAMRARVAAVRVNVLAPSGDSGTALVSKPEGVRGVRQLTLMRG